MRLGCAGAGEGDDAFIGSVLARRGGFAQELVDAGLGFEFVEFGEVGGGEDLDVEWRC